MADASKLRSLRRPGLGAPPAPDEARTDLVPPGPQSMPELTSDPAPRPAPAPATASVPSLAPRIDGRSLRRSGRTVQFATRVSPAFDDRLRRLAMQEGALLVEILERALDIYEASRKKDAI